MGASRNRRKRRRYIFLGFLGALIITFLLGPKPDYPAYTPDIEPSHLTLNEIEGFAEKQMQAVVGLKPGNESVIWWADSIPRQTEYAVIFLHGFSASPRGGMPFASDFAKRYGYNLYAPLLTGHGIDSDDSFENLTPADLINSAKEALAIGKVLGKKTILIGSSTGCTLGAYLAAHNPEYADALFFYAPNVKLADWKSNLLAMPWGLNLAYAIAGKYYHYDKLKGTPSEAFWQTTYRTEGLQALQYLLNETMQDDVFEKITQPLFVGYYYKDEEHKDGTISIPAVKDFFASVKTPENQKEMVAFPNAGGHVMLSKLQGQNVEETSAKTYEFVERVMGFKPVE